MTSKICPKCNKSREVMSEDRPDPAVKGKFWRITFCPSCRYNFEIDEVTREITIKEDPEKRKRRNWLSGG